MPHCPACNGSVPATAVSCPHCNIALNLSQSAASPRRDSSIVAIVLVAIVGVLFLGGVLVALSAFLIVGPPVAVHPKASSPAPPHPPVSSAAPSAASDADPGIPPDHSENSAEASPALPVPKLPE